MIFVTHLFFRRLFRRKHADEALGFRMWGYPWSSLAGAGLMIASLLTTFFTREFRMTLISGIPFLLLLTAAFLARYRHTPVSQPAVAAVELPS
jgi:L-asparagine transporter-like permease